MKMQTWSICAFVISLVCSGLGALAQDSVVASAPGAVHQLRISADLWHPVLSNIQGDYHAYEGQLDYSTDQRSLIYALEFGFARADYNYPDLSYDANSFFLRAGVDKTLLPRQSGKDWDIVFAGVRYGYAAIQRGAANYVITDTLYGSVTGTVPSANLSAHWAEITGGLRLELLRSLYVGWNVRGKFLLNGKALRSLPPSYIAGYGRGEKNSIFDFNVYVGYAIRWQRKDTGTR